MDDESYFTLQHHSMPGNSYYYSTARGDAPDHLQFADTKKFEEKLMIWLAISEEGISQPFFKPSGIAVNKEVYSSECIERRLVPFIEEFHDDGHYLFWPDLASSHYAHLTMDTFEKNNVAVVTKDCNPPVVPQLRPIEDFWGILKNAVYKNGWRANTHRQLKQRIKKCISEIDQEVVTSMMKNVTQRLKTALEYGFDSLLT
jgi:hypothetical protein